MKGNDPSSKKTTLDTFSAKCFSLFDYSSVEEAIHVFKLMLAKNCYGTFRFGPSAHGLRFINGVDYMAHALMHSQTFNFFFACFSTILAGTAKNV